MILSLLLCCLIPLNEPTGPCAPSPAAWIVVLRDRQIQGGMTSELWKDLVEARASVFDPYYTQPTPPVWMQSLYPFYLSFAPVVILLLCIACCWLAWKRKNSPNWMSSMALAGIWLVLVAVSLLPAMPDTRPAAVIKTPGIVLRQGNGLSYAALEKRGMPLALAAGVEAVYLTQRSNGWVQIQLPDGLRGWLPLDALYIIRDQ